MEQEMAKSFLATQAEEEARLETAAPPPAAAQPPEVVNLQISILREP